MFKRKTVFILGAGASWHYGYPTGETLVNMVIDQARELSGFCEISRKTLNAFVPKWLNPGGNPTDNVVVAKIWREFNNNALELARRLEQVNPTLIDYFLKQNADLQEIGKLVIAIVILRCEAEYEITRPNKNREIQNIKSPQPSTPINLSSDDWLRFVLYKMTAGCNSSAELLQNTVHFVTFNYDTSLERRLLRGLENISFFDKADIAEFLKPKRISHIYGQIAEPMQSPLIVKFPLPSSLYKDSDAQLRTTAQTTINNCWTISKGIFTIDGEEKGTAAEAIEHARKVIDEAEVIYILGYGFDDSNNKRLLLRESFLEAKHPREIMFTNLKGLARVSKAASRVMAGPPDTFIKSPVHQTDPFYNRAIVRQYREMSTKNCYDALAEDFESLED